MCYQYQFLHHSSESNRNTDYIAIVISRISSILWKISKSKRTNPEGHSSLFSKFFTKLDDLDKRILVKWGLSPGYPDYFPTEM